MKGIKKILNIILCLTITAIIAVWARGITWGGSNNVDIRIYMENEELYGANIVAGADGQIPVQLTVTDNKEGISAVYYKLVSEEGISENYTEVCPLGEAETLSADACDPEDATAGSLQEWDVIRDESGNAVSLSKWISLNLQGNLSVELAFIDMKGKYYSYQKNYYVTRVMENVNEEEPETEPTEVAETELSEEPETEIPPETETEPVVNAEIEITEDPETEAAAEPENEPVPEPATEPAVESELVVELETELTEEPETEIEFETEIVLEPESEMEQSTESEQEEESIDEPEPETEPESESETEPEPETEPVIEPVTEPETEPETEPVTEPEPETGLKSEPEVTEESYQEYHSEENYYQDDYYDSSYYYELGYYDGYTDYERYNVINDYAYSYNDYSYQADDIRDSYQEPENEQGIDDPEEAEQESGEAETKAEEKTKKEENREKAKTGKPENKDGSVYELTELEEINGKYLQESEDLVIYEKNADKLKQDSIMVTVAKDGETFELERGKDYTFRMTGMTDTVNTYTYRISRDVFADDGVYRVFLSSEDESGNKNYNEAKDASIRFSVDRTDPLIISYDPQADSTVRELKIKDNISLDSVGIYIGDEQVEYETEGDIYCFNIPEGCEETDVKVVASDSAGNTYERVLNDYIVTKSAGKVKKGSIVPAVIASAGIAAAVFAVFRIKKKNNKSTNAGR